MTQIKCSSEWMENHKQANIMAADQAFQALQTADHTSVFFSIGSDGIFYVTRQIDGHQVGWAKIDMSSRLSQLHDGKLVRAKSFRVASNPDNKLIDVALAVEVDKQDYLYLALGHQNDEASWADQIAWSYTPYDGGDTKLEKLIVSDIYIAQSHHSEYIVVDILKNPDDPDNFISRFYIDPSRNITGKVWNRHDLAANLQAGDITSRLGKKSEQRVDGIYTLGQINQNRELLYTPLYNPFNPNLPPNPARLDIPKDATSLATVSSGDGKTALFTTGDSGLIYFNADDQNDGDSGVRVISNELFKEGKELYAFNSDTHIVVWGLNQAGQIFYTKCGKGQELEPNAWTVPIPILSDVEQVACYLNDGSSSSVIFALRDGNNLTQLIQDATTTHWQERSIVLPSTDVNDVLQLNTYTSHIQIDDDAHIPLANQKVLITSTSPVSVYINNYFKMLTPDTPVEVAADASATITILQETQGATAVCYSVQLSGSSTKIDVNPMDKAIKTISKIKTGAELGAVKVTNANGTEKLLVPASVSTGDKDAAAQALQKLVEVSNTLPQNGSNQKNVRETQLDANNFLAQADSFWAIEFNEKGHQFFSGKMGMDEFGLMINEAGQLIIDRGGVHESIGHGIKSAAGDILNWLKHAFKEAEYLFCQSVDDVWNFFVKIGEDIYHFVMQCISDVVGAIEFIFKKIEVFVEDLIKWLGFIFQWDDIVRSHKVLKNVIKLFVGHTIDEIDDLKNKVALLFEDVEKHVNEWAGLKDNSTSIDQEAKDKHKDVGQNSAQANYGIYHMKTGISSASSSSKVNPNLSDELEQMIQTLIDAFEKEGVIFEKAYDTLKTQILDQLNSLSLGDILKRLTAIILDILIESVENIIVTALEILQELIQGVLAILDGPIDIPVISWLYKKVVGSDLSILDAVCLVIAIPGTIVYKIATDKAPFPDDSFTQDLIDAKSWSQLQEIFTNLEDQTADTSITMIGSSVKDGFIGFMDFAASMSSLLFVPLSVLKSETEGDGLKPISEIHGICFFTTTLPGIIASLISSSKQSWFAITGEVVYGITVLQKLADIFTYKPQMALWATASKGIDSILGIAGLVPALASPAANPTVRTVTNCLGNISWNANRIVTPVAKIDGSEVQIAFYVFKMGAILGYGAIQFILFIEAIAGADLSSMTASPSSRQ